MNALPWSRAAEDSVAWSALAPVRSGWTRCERIVSHAIAPTAASDADGRAAMIIQESAVGRGLTRIVVAVTASWQDSMLCGTCQALGRILDRGRRTVSGTSAIVLISASVTALALGQTAARRNPLGWVVPVFALLITLVVTLAARD